MTTLSQATIKNVVRNLLLPGKDYRVEIVNLINAQFLDSTISFFMEIAKAKMANKEIGVDWYRNAFMSESMPKDKIATNAGINVKTVSNIHGTTRKEIVIEAAHENYESVKSLIDNLIKAGEGVGVTIAIKFQNVSVDLNISESLVVINALAVKRAAMRGGMWSSVGKRAEKPLMLSLCRLYSVAPENYDVIQDKKDSAADFEREIDFFLVAGENRHKCEVKLMGKGNPESGDAVIARASKVFVADTLSQTNIKQLNSLDIEWVHLKQENGYRRFANVLENLNIPHKKYNGDLEKDIDKIIKSAFV
ncbi:MAG: CfrBI family restriction endonuclease [Gammaproteobacteria bacterium]